MPVVEPSRCRAMLRDRCGAAARGSGMDTTWGLFALGAAVAVPLARRIHSRLALSRAKHPSLAGHTKLSRRLARLIPYYAYDEAEFFASDDAPPAIAEARRA